ncbi:Redoxin domain protein [Alkalilimnicola ehrlichii MLHE-1]|uniref:Redoxin domain protein n=2 Tax=Alkalilimnicola ehrlichii TaxID=351052 RepID=Q0ABC2_ALKEH|nr:Redoxin domain protein [Alkalilimnicola ehrlichii MLHE-1]
MMMSVNLGPLALPLDRLPLLVALLAALLLSWLIGRRQGGNADGPLLVTGLIALIAGRLGFVLQYRNDYLAAPLSFINIADGGFSPVAAVVAIAGVGGFYALRRPLQRPALIGALVGGLLTWGAGMAAVQQLSPEPPALPEAHLQTLDGQPQPLADYRDGPLVINLWASWCPPCRREMPVLSAVQQARDDVTILLVNQGETADTIRTFLDELDSPLDHVLLDPRSGLSAHYGSGALPTTLFIDAEGRVIDSHLGELSRARLSRGIDAITGD